jgi:hypothetical protein
MDWFQFTLGDDCKLYLVHAVCGQRLTQVEADDTLGFLNRVADDHTCPD